MGNREVELKECFNTSKFLRPDQYASLLLILWRQTDYKKEKVPNIYYRIGYYELDDSDQEENDNPFFVGSSDLTRVSLYYFFPHLLNDYPIVLINLDLKNKQQRLAFIEVYDVDRQSINYVIPRIDKYCNPYQPEEIVYTEITWDDFSCTDETSEISEETSVLTSNTFHTFFNNIVKNDNSAQNITVNEETGQPCPVIIIDKDKKELRGHSDHSLEITKYCRSENDMFGFLWLNEIHWKLTQKQIGYCSIKTGLPVYLMPFIDPIITSVGDELVCNMLMSLKKKNVPHHLKDIIQKDSTTMCSPQILLSNKAIEKFCHMDVANALYSRRESVTSKYSTFDFGNRFGVLSYNQILNAIRTEMDPCDPYRDLQVTSLFSFSQCSQYINNMRTVAPEMVNTDIVKQIKRENNIVKLRIIAGEIVSLARNDVIYGVSKTQQPPHTMKILNERLDTIHRIAEHQVGNLSNIDPIIQSLNTKRENFKNEILQGFNEVETIVYLIDKEAIVLSPLLPIGICLHGEWCDPSISNVNVMNKLILLSDIFAIFYNYEHFIPIKTNLLERCLNDAGLIMV
jgi:hypothetical protein